MPPRPFSRPTPTARTSPELLVEKVIIIVVLISISPAIIGGIKARRQARRRLAQDVADTQLVRRVGVALEKCDRNDFDAAQLIHLYRQAPWAKHRALEQAQARGLPAAGALGARVDVETFLKPVAP